MLGFGRIEYKEDDGITLTYKGLVKAEVAIDLCCAVTEQMEKLKNKGPIRIRYFNLFPEKNYEEDKLWYKGRCRLSWLCQK